MSADTVPDANCLKLKALKSAENEVVECLESADLIKLCGEAVEIGVAPQHLMETLDSMDERVPCPRVIRYLLMHVYKSIEENFRLYDRWLHLLKTHGFAINKLLPRNVSDRDAILERHISALTELLAQQCASKWDQMCTALNLPESVRHDLNVKQMSCGAIPCFTHLLTEWVLGGYEHAKPPTLENLKEALRSPLVGRGAQAQLLQNVGEKTITPDAQPFEITRQCYDTVVSEGKSTLLEVQAATSQDTAILYEWKKDDSLFERGLYNSIICIRNANLSAEGVFQCFISIYESSLPNIEAKAIFLKVKVPSVKKELSDKYLAKPEIPEDSWPPESNHTYINLALIKPGNLSTEYARSTIQGSVDDVLADKESIEYETIFTNLKSGERLLIEGRPGSGKTTLVHKFSQDWARGNPILNLHNIKLLFLVHLRGFFNAPFQFRDIVQLYYSSQSTVDQVVGEAEEKNGEGICIILDGLDEYQPESMKQTFAYRLIKREMLTNSIVIVVSRPAASYQFRNTASRRIEVIGFLRDQIFNYIEKYPFSKAGKESCLHLYLADHPNVLHMCYLPIHAAMVCYLFDVMGNTLPQTETEMYKEFTNLTLLRTLTRDESKAESQYQTFESVEDLPEAEKKVFFEICELSFNKTMFSQQVITRAEVKGFLSNVNSGSESLGLITVDRMSRKYGFQNVYTFLHLTFQEYLAAYYVYMTKDQLKLLKHLVWLRHMRVVVKFFCGLAHFNEHDIRLTEILFLGKRSDCLFGVQCAFESQQSVVCDYVVESGEHGTLSFKEHFLTSSDLTAIGYVMKTSTYPVEKLVFDNCTYVQGVNEKTGVSERVQRTLSFFGTFHEVVRYKMLCLFLNSIKALDVSRYSSLHFHKTSTEETVTISGANNSDFKIVSDYLQQSQCTVLQLDYYCELRQDSLKFLTTGLEHCSSLQRLELTYCFIREFDEVVLYQFGKCLGQCCNLKVLHVVHCGIGGVFLFLECLQHCSGGLEEVALVQNDITDDNGKALAKNLQHCDGLKVLDLHDNNISNIGAVALAEILQHCYGLKVLDLHDNNIHSIGARALAENLQYCSGLESLDLHSNMICSIGARALAEGLQHCSCLQTLDLSFNPFDQDSAEALTKSLQHCKNLRTECISSEYTDLLAWAS